MRHWRKSAAFVGIAAACGLGGWWFHCQASTPRAEDPTTRPVPFRLGVYVGLPDERVDLTVQVAKAGPHAVARVFVTGNDSYLVTSNVPMTSNKLESTCRRVEGLASGTIGQQKRELRNPGNRYACYTPRLGIVSSVSLSPARILLATIPIRAESFSDSGTLISARLPEVGIAEFWEREDRFFPAYGITSMSPPSSVYRGPYPTSPRTAFQKRDVRPESYESDSRTMSFLYWRPASLSSRVVLVGTASQLLQSDLRVNTPATGTVAGADYQWTGGFQLAPVLGAIARGAEESRNNDVFFSGLLLGAAFTAAIAFIQERRTPVGHSLDKNPGASALPSQRLAGLPRILLILLYVAATLASARRRRRRSHT